MKKIAVSGKGFTKNKKYQMLMRFSLDFETIETICSVIDANNANCHSPVIKSKNKTTADISIGFAMKNQIKFLKYMKHLEGKYKVPKNAEESNVKSIWTNWNSPKFTFYVHPRIVSITPIIEQQIMEIKSENVNNFRDALYGNYVQNENLMLCDLGEYGISNG